MFFAPKKSASSKPAAAKIGSSSSSSIKGREPKSLKELRAAAAEDDDDHGDGDQAKQEVDLPVTPCYFVVLHLCFVFCGFVSLLLFVEKKKYTGTV